MNDAKLRTREAATQRLPRCRFGYLRPRPLGAATRKPQAGPRPSFNMAASAQSSGTGSARGDGEPTVSCCAALCTSTYR